MAFFARGSCARRAAQFQGGAVRTGEASWPSPADSLGYAVTKDSESSFDPQRQGVRDESRVACWRSGVRIFHSGFEGREELRVVTAFFRRGALECFSDHVGWGGPGLLAHVTHTAPARPWFAIGGISLGRLDD